MIHISVGSCGGLGRPRGARPGRALNAAASAPARLFDPLRGVAVMDVVGREQAEAGVAVHVVLLDEEARESAPGGSGRVRPAGSHIDRGTTPRGGHRLDRNPSR